MTSLFDDLKQGLQEAIDFANGDGPARVTTYIIEPVKELDREEIKALRNSANMTQSVFADYMGVSVKTVEAWERGRTHPTGPAYRLMSILSDNQNAVLPFVKTV